MSILEDMGGRWQPHYKFDRRESFRITLRVRLRHHTGIEASQCPRELLWDCARFRLRLITVLICIGIM